MGKVKKTGLERKTKLAPKILQFRLHSRLTGVYYVSELKKKQKNTTQYISKNGGVRRPPNILSFIKATRKVAKIIRINCIKTLETKGL